MKKQDILDNIFKTRVAAEITLDGFNVLILDLASLDDGGWQVRESYISRVGLDDYIQVTHGDGYNGWDVATQCCYPTTDNTNKICAHLKIKEVWLDSLLEEVVDSHEHLNSTDFDMLDILQGEDNES